MTLQAFAKQKAYLICVDSDGCAMDTMDIKHFRCFGPCMVEEWGLEEWSEAILRRWNAINLYSGTRGINRFKGLAMALTEIDKVYCPIEGVAELAAWAEHAPELSNQAIAEAAKTAQGPCLAKALSWSQKVNAAIDALPESDKKPFPGVAEALAAAHRVADVAIVSSANREAVEEEWTRCGLLPSVDVLCCQDSGSKAACIAQLKEKGYDPAHILMVGDAPRRPGRRREKWGPVLPHPGPPRGGKLGGLHRPGFARPAGRPLCPLRRGNGPPFRKEPAVRRRQPAPAVSLFARSLCDSFFLPFFSFSF